MLLDISFCIFNELMNKITLLRRIFTNVEKDRPFLRNYFPNSRIGSSYLFMLASSYIKVINYMTFFL